MITNTGMLMTTFYIKSLFLFVQNLKTKYLLKQVLITQIVQIPNYNSILSDANESTHSNF